MKKLIFALCVCAGLCACSSDDDLVSSSSSEMPDGTVSYLKVRIKDVNSQTRAEAGGYAYGTEDEYAVNNAYFYFYDKDGNYVAKGNVADPTGSATTDPESGGNIEWSSETVVAVWGIADTTLPTQMLTVLNQPSSFDGTNKTLAQATAALAGTPWGDTTNGFVMSTSVYESGTTVVNTTALKADDFRSEPVNLTQDYDETNPAVDVYVERLAAKVGLSLASTAYDSTDQNAQGHYFIPVSATSTFVTWDEWAKVPTNDSNFPYYIELLGWNVDAIARDAYLSKQIDTSWQFTWGTSDSWNDATDSRCFWAASPAYGDASHVYQASNWKLNTPEEEADASTWLDDYLEYTSLETPINFGSATYIGENTNSQTVINALAAADSSSCFTDVLVKAQFGYRDPNGANLTPVDIVKYHGEYLTLADFETDMISEVIRYDFSSMVDEVKEAIDTKYGSYPFIGTYIKDFADALEPAVYMKKQNDETATYEEFDSRFVQLINKGSGYVGIWFDTKTSADAEGNTHSNHSDTYPDKKIPNDYNKPVVMKAKESMDDYDFYFKINEDKIQEFSGILSFLEQYGLITEGQDYEGYTNYYFPLSEELTISISANSYDARNYLIRAIERESAGIDDDWSTAGYPNLYADGLMYYYVPIEHLGAAGTDDAGNTTITEGQYGVVRNHWYDITVTSISDLGHGIADEKEVIVPAPELPYYYMGADINILSWQMVNQSVAW